MIEFDFRASFSTVPSSLSQMVSSQTLIMIIAVGFCWIFRKYNKLVNLCVLSTTYGKDLSEQVIIDNTVPTLVVVLVTILIVSVFIWDRCNHKLTNDMLLVIHVYQLGSNMSFCNTIAAVSV